VLEKVRHKSPSLCRLLPFVDSVSVHLSSWLVAVTTAQTAFHRARPASQAPPVSGPPRPPKRFDGARSVVLLLVVVIVCLDAHYFWSYALVEMDRTPPGELICSNMRQNELFRDVIRPAVELLVFNLAPFIMIILSLIAVSMNIIVVLQPNTHCRRRRDSTIELSRVGGVNTPVDSRDPVYNFLCC